MTERERKTAFVLSAICIAAVWVGLQLVEGDSTVIEDGVESEATSSAADTASSGDPLVLGEDPRPQDGGGGGRRDGGPKETEPVDPAAAEDLPAGAQVSAQATARLEQAEEQARRFMDAFLVYEVEGPTASIRDALTPLASPALAAAIAADELRPGSGDSSDPEQGALLNVQGEQTSKTEVAVIASVAYAGEPRGVLLTLEDSRAGWVVTDVV